MDLNRETVERIAELARLELSDQEIAAYTEQLGHILEHFETLAALETDDVPPTTSVVEFAPAYREDVVSNPPAPEALRANAPDRDGDHFRVPKIIE